jgi:cation-transporting P-type ATPase F
MMFHKKKQPSSFLVLTTDRAWHQLSSEEVATLLSGAVATGLSADEVRHRQKESGPNRVTAQRGTPAWVKFLQQFNQPLVYILLVAVTVTAALNRPRCAGVKDTAHRGRFALA